MAGLQLYSFQPSRAGQWTLKGKRTYLSIDASSLCVCFLTSKTEKETTTLNNVSPNSLPQRSYKMNNYFHIHHALSA